MVSQDLKKVYFPKPIKFLKKARKIIINIGEFIYTLKIGRLDPRLKTFN